MKRVAPIWQTGMYQVDCDPSLAGFVQQLIHNQEAAVACSMVQSRVLVPIHG
jgi:hypothetical protein